MEGTVRRRAATRRIRPMLPRPAWTTRGFGQRRLSEQARAALIIALVTFASRWWIIGDPLVHVDEQFYLVVGRRMVEGHLPYVDVFDVKPIGLFAIYALANLVPANPVVAYQLLAAISVGLTAFILFRVARLLTGPVAALGGACVYVGWLTVFQGIGGQSPVFYNLPLSAAAALLIGLASHDRPRDLRLRGCAVMLLMGIAFQIKPTVVFEGAYFGLALIALARRSGCRGAPLLRDAGLWAACALAPTLVALIAYAAAGHAAVFVQSNFISIFDREIDARQMAAALARLAEQLLALTPFWVCAAIAIPRLRLREASGRPALIAVGWAAASLAGYLVIGTWSEHFVLALLPSFSLLAALACHALADRQAAVIRLVGVGLIAGLGRSACEVATEGNARDAQRVANLVTPHLRHGCLYLVNAPPVLYLLTHSCLPTRYVFPSHLLSQKYARSLGSDPAAEMRRLLAQRPAAIVTGGPYANPNKANQRLLEAELHRNYSLLTATRIGIKPLLIFTRKADGDRR